MSRKSAAITMVRSLLTTFGSLTPSIGQLSATVQFPRCTLPRAIASAQSRESYSTFNKSSSPDGNDDGKKARRGRISEKRVPRLVHIQHPLKYLKNRWDLLRLKLFWDFSFRQNDFLYGARKALVVVTDYIRDQNAMEIHDVATTGGFKQIARDMILSRTDPRIRLMKFRISDIQTAIPAKVFLIKLAGRSHCMIDTFFVGMRNVSDFDSDHELKEISESVKLFDAASENGREYGPDRIIFSEVYVRFYREYTKGAPAEWAVALFKVLNFDVL